MFITGKIVVRYRFMMQKNIYSKPATTFVCLKIEEQLLTISAATTNPVEGWRPYGRQRLYAEPVCGYGWCKTAYVG